MLEGIGEGQRRGVEGPREIGDEFRVDLVGFGQPVPGFGEVANLPGIEKDDGMAGRVSLSDEQRLVTAARFAHPDRLGGRRFQPARDGFFRVGNLMGLTVVMEIKAEPGNIDADVGFHGLGRSLG